MAIFSREAPRHYLLGLFMGTADAVPGVSGGTIAFITGIYPRLIDALAGLTVRNGLRFFDALVPPDIERLQQVLEDLDATFLISLVAGIFTALIVVTRFVVFAEEHYPVLLFGFFFGLIAVAVVILARQVTLSEPRHWGVAVAGFLISFLLSGDLTLLQGHGPVLIFVAGVVAISAMILPGISGALILVILGQYVFLSSTLTAFTNGLVTLLSGGSMGVLVGPGTTILVFMLGATVGLLTIARLVDRALESAPTMTLAFLVSLVVGALRAPIAAINGRGIPWSGETIVTFVLAVGLGAVVLYVLDYFAMDVEIDTGVGS